jgi:Arc/MetJ-type ribon-helix-helix transcriptional regulator
MEFRPIPAANKYGHSATLSCKVLPEMAVEIQALVQSGRFPFRTNSDLMRHALDSSIRELNDSEPGLINRDATELMQEIVTRERRYNELSSMAEEAVRMIGEAVTQGRVQDAKRLFQQVHAVLSDLPEGEMQGNCLTLVGRFMFLKDTAPMSLRPGEAQ